MSDTMEATSLTGPSSPSKADTMESTSLRGSKSPTDPRQEALMSSKRDLVHKEHICDEQPEGKMTVDDQSTTVSRESAGSLISIFDRKTLLQHLDDAHLPIKQRHLEMFMEALHRQHYPPLNDFIADYCRHLVARKNGEPDCASSTSSEESGWSLTKKYRKLSPHLVGFFSNNQCFETTTSKIISTTISKTGSATRIEIALHDGHVIETMLMRYKEGHASVSLSTQVGCSHGCTFSNTSAFQRNLSTAEILEQVVHATHVLLDQDPSCHGSRYLIRNAAFFGSGEPLDNYENVVEACHVLSQPKLWGLCRGRITISTIGITPRIYELTRDLPDVILAVSLHAPNQRLRREIVPVAEQYSFEGLMEAIDNHVNSCVEQTPKADGETKSTRRRNVMIEYILVEGTTCPLIRAHELGHLCQDRHLVVNLVPYTRVGDDDKHRCPSLEHMKKFQAIVTSYGVLCNIRLTMSTELGSSKLIVSPESYLERYSRRQSEKERTTEKTNEVLDSPVARVLFPDEPEEKREQETTAEPQEECSESAPETKAPPDYSPERAELIHRRQMVAAVVISVALLSGILLSSRRR